MDTLWRNATASKQTKATSRDGTYSSLHQQPSMFSSKIYISPDLIHKCTTDLEEGSPIKIDAHEVMIHMTQDAFPIAISNFPGVP